MGVTEEIVEGDKTLLTLRPHRRNSKIQVKYTVEWLGKLVAVMSLISGTVQAQCTKSLFCLRHERRLLFCPRHESLLLKRGSSKTPTFGLREGPPKAPRR